VPEPINTESGSGATSAKWRVLLLNDDHTPMEFVVHLLQELFDTEHDVAVHLMLHIHHHGVGACGVYPRRRRRRRSQPCWPWRVSTGIHCNASWSKSDRPDRPINP
jgi:hypothetical protein